MDEVPNNLISYFFGWENYWKFFHWRCRVEDRIIHFLKVITLMNLFRKYVSAGRLLGTLDREKLEGWRFLYSQNHGKTFWWVRAIHNKSGHFIDSHFHHSREAATALVVLKIIAYEKR